MSDTPILDRVEPMPSPRKRGSASRVMTSVVSVAVGALVGVLAGRMSGHVSLFSMESLIAILLGLRLCILIHEFGHLVAGLATGFHFRSLTAWPLSIVNLEGRLQFATPKSFAFGGATIMLPGDWPRSRFRTIALMAGGVVANGATAIAGVFAMRALHAAYLGISPSSDTLLLVGLLTLRWTTLFSALTATTNLLPVRTGRLTWDGARIVDALANGERFVRLDAINRLARQFSQGRTSPEIDRALVLEAVKVDDDSHDAMIANLTAYAHFADTDIDESARYLELALRSTGSASEPERLQYMAECAVYWGWYRRDALQARAWADAARNPKLQTLSRLRAGAALACAENRWDDAIAFLREARALPQVAKSPVRRALERGLDQWIGKIEATQPREAYA